MRQEKYQSLWRCELFAREKNNEHIDNAADERPAVKNGAVNSYSISGYQLYSSSCNALTPPAGGEFRGLTTSTSSTIEHTSTASDLEPISPSARRTLEPVCSIATSPTAKKTLQPVATASPKRTRSPRRSIGSTHQATGAFGSLIVMEGAPLQCVSALSATTSSRRQRHMRHTSDRSESKTSPHSTSTIQSHVVAAAVVDCGGVDESAEEQQLDNAFAALRKEEQEQWTIQRCRQAAPQPAHHHVPAPPPPSRTSAQLPPPLSLGTATHTDQDLSARTPINADIICNTKGAPGQEGAPLHLAIAAPSKPSVTRFPALFVTGMSPQSLTAGPALPVQLNTVNVCR